MALNINFQGNVVNEAGDLITCKYQAYVPSISKWGNVKETEASQYNINYGDGDLKTQSSSVANGEKILIAFWTGDDSRQNELELFAVVAFTYTGIDNTVQDILLKQPHKPSCAFSMQSEGLVGVSVNTTSHASLITQWTYEHCTHFQRPDWYGADVFSFMAITDDSFSFHNEYIDQTSSTFTEHGVYPIKHRVINSYNLQAVCEKSIKIRYRPPVPKITFFPPNLIAGTKFDIINSSTDIDSRITNIVYTFEDEVVTENINNSYTYSKTASEFKVYTAKQTIHWNDGFEDKTVTVTASPTMSNTPPTIDLNIEKDDNLKGVHKAKVTASDLEGPITRLNWKIFYLDTNSGLPNPFFEIGDTSSSNGYRKIYDSDGTMEEAIRELVFAIKGTYRIEATVYDENGLSATDEVIVEITETCIEDKEPEPIVDCENMEEIIAEAIEKHDKIAAIDRAIENMGKVTDCKKIMIADTVAEDYIGGVPAGEPLVAGRVGVISDGIGGSPVGEPDIIDRHGVPIDGKGGSLPSHTGVSGGIIGSPGPGSIGESGSPGSIKGS